MSSEVLDELKKMNKYLEAIDWKLWNLHQKVIGPKKEIAPDLVSKSSDSDLDSLVSTLGSNNDPVQIPTRQSDIPKPVIESKVVSVPKYPSIEEWK